jgi:hypothetical protein
MTDANLVRFRLRFPRDVDERSVVAALSAFAGLPHGTRLVFSLTASDAGIEHRLAITRQAVDTVAGGLRASMPSLRLDAIDTPTETYRRRELWQLMPTTAAIRTDELPSIVAALLASCYPLHGRERIELLWTVRPAMRPRVDLTGEAPRQGRALALRHKLALPGVSARGELRADAATAARATALLRRTEPLCWRHYDGYGGQRITLKPDSYARLGIGPYEDSYFIEVDRGTEGSRALSWQLKRYVAYHRAGHEQAERGVFPKVLWLADTAERVGVIEDCIAALPSEQRTLFAVSDFEAAIGLMTGETA